MKIKLRLLLLFLFLSLAAYAQEKGDVYYSGHQNEILPDAESLFRKGNYDRALQLCDLHKELLGLDHAEAGKVDELRALILECQKLAMDMEGYLERGHEGLARAVAEELRKLNPTDERLKQLSSRKKQTTKVDKTSREQEKPKEAEQPKVVEQPKADEQPKEVEQPKEQEQTVVPEQPKEQEALKEQEAPKEQKLPIKPVEPAEQDDIDDDFYSSYPAGDDYFPPRFVVTAGASIIGLGQTGSAIAPGIGVGMYDIGESIIGAEARAYLAPGMASSTALMFGLDAGAVIRIVKGIYASAGLGFFSCSPTKSEGTATLGLCIPAGVSVLIGKAFVIQAGVSYYPSVDIGVTKTVKTSVGPSYSITTAQNVLQACVAPRISLGFAF